MLFLRCAGSSTENPAAPEVKAPRSLQSALCLQFIETMTHDKYNSLITVIFIYIL